MTIVYITAIQVKERLKRREELALIDVREHGEYGERHPFHSVNVPFSRFELEITDRVPRLDAPLVLFDEAGEGRAQRCAAAAQSIGYTHVMILTGGASGWQAEGYTLFAGVNVPSKTFGELVEEHFHTPSVSAQQLADWQAQCKSVTVLDGRTEQEYRKRSIPQASNCPNGELPLRARSMVKDPEQPVIIHCAGRTRSFVGAQTLRILAPELDVYALENGTQGWELAGQKLAFGQNQMYPQDAKPTAEQQTRAQQWADQCGALALDVQGARRWLDDVSRTLYLMDVRTLSEYQTHPYLSTSHTPGGQLVQATDHWVGVKHSRVILFSDDGCRGPNTAAWLSLMGYETAWYQGTQAQWVELMTPDRLKRTPTKPTYADLPMATLTNELSTQHQWLDARSSDQYRTGHYAGSTWVNRALLDQQLLALDNSRNVILVADQAEQAKLLRPAIEATGRAVTGWLTFDPEQAKQVNLAVEVTPDVPADSDCIDYLFFVHDRHAGNLEAARQYLDWEVGLVAQLDAEERTTFRL
ncbi:MAG: rhodanese-like domain-containing protein [Natronospirillum sp.]